MKLETARASRRRAGRAGRRRRRRRARSAGARASRRARVNVRQSPCTSTITGSAARASARPTSAAAPTNGIGRRRSRPAGSSPIWRRTPQRQPQVEEQAVELARATRRAQAGSGRRSAPLSARRRAEHAVVELLLDRVPLLREPRRAAAGGSAHGRRRERAGRSVISRPPPGAPRAGRRSTSLDERRDRRLRRRCKPVAQARLLEDAPDRSRQLVRVARAARAGRSRRRARPRARRRRRSRPPARRPRAPRPPSAAGSPSRSRAAPASAPATMRSASSRGSAGRGTRPAPRRRSRARRSSSRALGPVADDDEPCVRHARDRLDRDAERLLPRQPADEDERARLELLRRRPRAAAARDSSGRGAGVAASPQPPRDLGEVRARDDDRRGRPERPRPSGLERAHRPARRAPGTPRACPRSRP